MGQIGEWEREVEIPAPVTVPEEWPEPVEEPAEPQRQDNPERVPA